MRRLLSTLAVLGLAAGAASAQSLVISEVYGGGGNTGAPFNRDFVELFNNSDVDVSLAGFSVQYASASGTFDAGNVVSLTGTITARSFYVVGFASGGAAGVALPMTPQATGSTNLSATSGKVALRNSTTALGSGGPTTTGVLDFIGYGVANQFEDANGDTLDQAPGGSNTTSIQRIVSGTTPVTFQDTNENVADFIVGGPTPFAQSVVAPEPGTFALLFVALPVAGAVIARRRKAGK